MNDIKAINGYIKKVRLYRKAGSISESMEACLEAMARFPDSFDLLYEYAALLHAGRQYSKECGILEGLLSMEQDKRLAQDSPEARSFYLSLCKSYLMAKKYAEFEALSEVARHKFTIPAAPFHVDKTFELVINKKGAPLIILFQGFKLGVIKQYFSISEPEDIKSLNISGLPYAFQGFSRECGDYNYLFVKDNYQSWYLLNFDGYVKYMRNVIDENDAPRVACVGFSSGGFGAIVLGQAINADISIGMSPQTIAFEVFSNPYNRKLNKLFMLSLNQYSDLAALQAREGGFGRKVAIYVCERKKGDYEQVMRLEQGDANLKIDFLKCGNHMVASFLGKKALFEKLFADIAAAF